MKNEFRIFYERRREVFRVKHLQLPRPKNLFFPWFTSRVPRWEWVRSTTDYEHFTLRGPKEFSSRKDTEAWIADQAPDDWAEVE